MADKLASYGVDIFQLRAKDLDDKDLINTAEKLSMIIHKRKKLFLVNDRADIAYLSGADGLHLGWADIGSNQARKILGNKSIIGRTVHSLSELHKFSKEKIDYLSIGPVFKTKTKPNLPPLKIKRLQSLASKAQKLTFAIGGITLYNIQSLTQIDINNIAICRGIILESDLKSTVKNFKKCLQKVS